MDHGTCCSDLSGLPDASHIRHIPLSVGFIGEGDRAGVGIIFWDANKQAEIPWTISNSGCGVLGYHHQL